MMITKDSIESAYCFFHQKYRVYAFSHSDMQRDDIEYAISSYVEGMSRELYSALAGNRGDFLLCHASFDSDMREAIARLENLMDGRQTIK
ncbi:hypothetical protein JCM15908A_02770 [Prevotella dentasini JCM 15908]